MARGNNMKNERFGQISEGVKTVSIAVSLLLTIGGVVIGIFNYLTLAQLQPFGVRITTVEKQLQAYEQEQAKLFEKLATKIQVDDLTVRLDRVSGRVDLLINKLIK